MQITKDLLESKLKEYIAGRNQAQANLAMYDGAIQDVQIWLAKLDEPTPAISTTTSEPPTSQPESP